MNYSVGQEINKLKKTFLMRVGLTVLLLPVFVLVQAPSSASVDPAYSQGGSGSAGSCAGSNDIIPDSVYVRLGKGQNQTYSGFKIYLSFENGKCDELLYSSNNTVVDRGSQFDKIDDFLVSLN